MMGCKKDAQLLLTGCNQQGVFAVLFRGVYDDDDDEEKEEEKDQEEEEVCSWGSNPFPNEILQGSHSNPILVS